MGLCYNGIQLYSSEHNITGDKVFLVDTSHLSLLRLSVLHDFYMCENVSILAL